MIGGADKITSAWGHVYPGGYDLFVQLIARAVKQGFHVVLCEPGSDLPACTATDAALKRGHSCAVHGTAFGWDTLAPQENASKVRPMVRRAVEIAEARYGSPLNVAIALHESGYSHAESPSGPATISGTPRAEAWLVSGTGGRGGLQLVPPSVVDGVPLACWSTCDDQRV